MAVRTGAERLAGEPGLVGDGRLGLITNFTGVLLFDIQDIGTRFYTYIWTMYDCLQAATRLGKRFVVLDRPNPLGGLRVEGPLLQPGFESFVGRAPRRHQPQRGARDDPAVHDHRRSVPRRAVRPHVARLRAAWRRLPSYLVRACVQQVRR
ncbi:exo-beta-N-acetylmuramidase NamZ domain-containing protein [Kribbella sp. NPDC050470]|uniref:exo-beta-N-acetylmuramidase NamZ domain-containing protein n=1 Tax=unclassified Kribbella TaxID=2644121 RepID=UPI0037A3BE1A